MSCLSIIFFPLNFPIANWYWPARLHGFKLKEDVAGKGICKENLLKNKDIFQRGKEKEAAYLKTLSFVSKYFFFSPCLAPETHKYP